MWCASDGGHGECLLILVGGVVEVVLALTKVDEFELTLLCDEYVRWLNIPMADAFTLQE